MAKPKLTGEQQEALLTLLAAEYDTGLIVKWFAERNWPKLSRATFSYYRKNYWGDIDTLRKARRESALNEGLALKEERVKRLAQHADALEAIKWEPDEHGRLWNEKAWRETLDDIAAETGGRVKNVDVKSDGKAIEKVEDASKFDRAILTLADAIREAVPGAAAKPDGALDAAEQAPVAGAAKSGG